MQRIRKTLVFLTTVAPAAFAGQSKDPQRQGVIRSYVVSDPNLPLTRQQIVAELKAKGSLDRFGIRPDTSTTLDKPLTERQTEQLAVADHATYAAHPQPTSTGDVAPLAKNYDYITPEECDAHSDQARQPAGWIKNHFAYYQIHDIYQVAIEFVPDPVPVGTFAATVRLIGNGKTGIAPGTTASRWVSFDFNVDVTSVDGVFGDQNAKLTVQIPCRGTYDNSTGGSPANACHPGSASEVQKSIPDWWLNGDASLDLFSDAATPARVNGQQVARATFRPRYRFSIPGFFQFYTPRGEVGGVRFDSAWYLGGPNDPNRLGSIFDRTAPSIALSKTTNPDPNLDVSNIALHIQDARRQQSALQPKP